MHVLLVTLSLLSAPAVDSSRPSDALLARLPANPDPVAVLVVEGLRETSASWLGSPMWAKLSTLPAYAAWKESPEARRLDAAWRDVESLTGSTSDQLRDGVLGDAVVLALYPSTLGSKDPPVGLLLLRPQDPKRLASVITSINAADAKAGRIERVEPRTTEGGVLYARIGAKGNRNGSFYVVGRDGIAAWSSSEALVRGVLDRGRGDLSRFMRQDADFAAQPLVTDSPGRNGPPPDLAGRDEMARVAPWIRALRRGLPDRSLIELYANPELWREMVGEEPTHVGGAPRTPGEMSLALARHCHGLAASFDLGDAPTLEVVARFRAGDGLRFQDLFGAGTSKLPDAAWNETPAPGGVAWARARLDLPRIARWLFDEASRQQGAAPRGGAASSRAVLLSRFVEAFMPDEGHDLRWMLEHLGPDLRVRVMRPSPPNPGKERRQDVVVLAAAEVGDPVVAQGLRRMARALFALIGLDEAKNPEGVDLQSNEYPGGRSVLMLDLPRDPLAVWTGPRWIVAGNDPVQAEHWLGQLEEETPVEKTAAGAGWLAVAGFPLTELHSWGRSELAQWTDRVARERSLDRATAEREVLRILEVLELLRDFRVGLRTDEGAGSVFVKVRARLTTMLPVTTETPPGQPAAGDR